MIGRPRLELGAGKYSCLGLIKTLPYVCVCIYIHTYTHNRPPKLYSTKWDLKKTIEFKDTT